MLMSCSSLLMVGDEICDKSVASSDGAVTVNYIVNGKLTDYPVTVDQALWLNIIPRTHSQCPFFVT